MAFVRAEQASPSFMDPHGHQAKFSELFCAHEGLQHGWLLPELQREATRHQKLTLSARSCSATQLTRAAWKNVGTRFEFETQRWRRPKQQNCFGRLLRVLVDRAFAGMLPPMLFAGITNVKQSQNTSC